MSERAKRIAVRALLVPLRAGGVIYWYLGGALIHRTPREERTALEEARRAAGRQEGDRGSLPGETTPRRR